MVTHCARTRGGPLGAAVLIGMLAVLLSSAAARGQERFDLEPGDRVVVVGNTFGERLALSGYFDALAHAAHPDHDLVIRHVPWSADEVGLRPREMNVPTMEDHLAAYEADAIVMCFGMTESFGGREGLERFKEDLRALTESVRAARSNGESPPRLVLVSPIAHEDLGGPLPTGAEVEARNEAIGVYRDALRAGAEETGARFVDLFDASGRAYRSSERALTTNGIHPNDFGYHVLTREMGRQLGWLDGSEGEVSPEDVRAAEALRALAYDKHWHHRLVYRPTNTEYVWGRRHEPFGIVNFPPEMAQLERMVAARERAMWEMEKPSPEALFASPPSGAAVWETPPEPGRFPEDEWEPEPVEAKGTETSLGSTEILPPEEFAASFRVADGYVVECFASEREFELLQNPMAMTFDNRHRLWVLTTPTYPHLLPGEAPRCRLLVLEDRDGDGKADELTVFADRLYVPMGFAVDTDGVYVGQAPDLLKLTDTDGDGVADRRETIASGFAMPDSHHQMSAFEWDPTGGFVFHEGVFGRSNVETPYGPRRTRDAAVWRFDPRTERLSVMSHCEFANPWGHVFDDWGMSILADASGGSTYTFQQVITPFEYPNKPRKPEHFHNRGRPTAGCELISSRHFPGPVQGTFLINQSIGFHGTRWDRVMPSGSGLRSERMGQDLIESGDTNFRPVAMEIGPDGALYIVDWCNPIVGHMQYSVRDPRRDHAHGRIWRVRHESRPLLDPPDVAGASIGELLELLRLPERNTRQHARRRLQTLPANEVFPVLLTWLAALDNADPLHDRLVLEALWVHQGQGRIDVALLEQVLGLEDPRARAGGVRVLRHWLEGGEVEPGAGLRILSEAVHDEDMRVRLEAVVACGFVESAEASAIAQLAADHPMDEGFRVAFEEVLTYLGRYGEARSGIARRLRLERQGADVLLMQPMDETVAEVMLSRPDVPRDRREAALGHLADARAQAEVECLLDVLEGASDGAAAARSIAPMLVGQSESALAGVSSRLEDLAGAEERGVRAAACAALVRMGRSLREVTGTDRALAIEVVSLLAPERMPSDATAVLEAAVDDPELAASAVEQLVRTSPDTGATFAWLAERVESARDVPFDRWGEGHVVAMAALRGMHGVGAWPEGFDEYRRPVATEAELAAGREVYLDEGIGCARCHGVDGGGTEGFPPLAGSPWVVGDPVRAAAIVVHGLTGEIRMPGGERYASVMAPLGGNLSDEQVASVLTYVRQSWGNWAAPVTTAHVAQAWRLHPPRAGMWRTDDLLERFPLGEDLVLRPVSVPGGGAGGSGPGAAGAKAAPSELGGILRALGLTLLVVLVLSGVFLAVVLRRGQAG